MKRYFMRYQKTGAILSIKLNGIEHKHFLSVGWEEITEEEFLKLEKELQYGL